MERVSSGNARLDGILGGGLPANAINLIVGHPGSGKTILAQQYVFRNATPERPALYLTTVSEPLEKILRYGQSLHFFRPADVGETVVYDDLGSVVNEQGLDAVVSKIVTLLRERRPGLVVIDGFTALAAYAETTADFRRFLHELAAHLSAFPATTFWIGEYTASQAAAAPEFAVADAIISLEASVVGRRRLRHLQVLKLRGSALAGGHHAYRISADGLDVFPRLADPVNPSSYALDEQRTSSGIAALDEMLDHGYWSGASTLCAGPTGVGKTIMGLHFLFHGVRNGEPGVIATFEENPSQLERTARSFGWSFEEAGAEMMYRSPVDIYVDEWLYDLFDLLETSGARRVVVDSLSDLELAAHDAIAFREYMYSFVQRLSRLGTSTFMTAEVAELFSIGRLSEYGVSHLSDNVILLQYVPEGTTIQRAMTVLKTRASGHRPEPRKFEITGDGIVLGDVVDPFQTSPA